MDTCDSSDDRCAKLQVNYNVNSDVGRGFYSKGCATSADCNEVKCRSVITRGDITECDTSCCEGDLCNRAEVPMVSAIILMSCALAAFFL